MDMFQTELSSTAGAPQVARDWLRPKLEAWDFGGVTDEADLLVTELVANVVTHVSQPMEVRLTRRGDTVRVEVDDPSPVTPVVMHPDADDTGGRGVWLVASLAARWGSEVHPDDGKSVWFELDRARPYRADSSTTPPARADVRAARS